MLWISSRRIFFGAALLVGLASSPKSSVPVGPLAQPYDDAGGSVQFDIKPLEGKPGAAQWAATYSTRGKTAKFRIELAATTPAKETDFPFSIGKGRILSEPGSNASILLVDLKKALGGQNHTNQRWQGCLAALRVCHPGKGTVAFLRRQLQRQSGRRVGQYEDISRR